MRRAFVLFLAAILLTFSAFAKGSRSTRSHTSPSTGTGSKSSSTTVRGYTTRKGTHVNPYHRSTPDGTQKNNYSTKGNVNPYSGKPGTKEATK